MGDDGSLNVEELAHLALLKVPEALRLTLAKGIAALDWSEFEKLAAAIFEWLGYEVRLTPATDDQGIDLVLTEKKSGRLDVAQCKHWKDQIGSPVVRDFYGAMVHFQARRGFLITTGGLTESGLEFASGKPIIVWGPDELINEILRFAIRQGAAEGMSKSVTKFVENFAEISVPVQARMRLNETWRELDNFSRQLRNATYNESPAKDTPL